MSSIRQLAGQTAVYGLSSIVGRLLNYLLVPFYTRIFTQAEYGVVSELFAYSAFLMILFTYGMETSFFHFSEKEGNRERVFSTGVWSLLGSSAVMALLLIVFAQPVAGWIRYPGHAEYIVWFALILFFDAMTSLPFARLRQQNKARRFAVVKLTNIAVNIFFNIFFLVICPALSDQAGMAGDVVRFVYSDKTGAGYVFVSNLIASAVTVVMLLPEFRELTGRPDAVLLRRMVLYGLPLLVAGFAGMINETLDRAVYKYLAPDPDSALRELGVYSACYKLSIIMTLFIQTYRYAAEPFFFSQQNKENSRALYASVMKYFVIACAFIFLAVLLYLDVIKLFIGERFREGLAVVPILLLANWFLGIYFNLSMWYKLTGQTRFGAYFSLLGAVITVVLLFLLVPAMGYVGAAWATLACYGSMMVVSFTTGQKRYPIPYDLPRIATYMLLALLIYFADIGIRRLAEPQGLAKFGLETLLLALFAAFVFLTEKRKK